MFEAEFGICRGCGCRIRWVVMEKSGKRNPLDPEPTIGGNVEITPDGKGRQMSIAMPKLYLSHFATCPKAQHFRRSL